MQLSVVTPLFNRLELTIACRESLERTLAGWDYEWILVDDGSTDGTRDWLRALPEDGRTRVVLNDAPLGYGANNNLGVGLARAPLLCLLNNDTVLTPGWLEPMARVARLLPDAGCVGNVQRELVGGLIDHAGIFFDREAGTHHAAKNEAVAPREDYLQWPAVTAACCVVRKEVFLDVGGFDEVFRNGGEDVDFCLRAGVRGYRHFVANRSQIYHHVSASPGRTLHQAKNEQIFRERWLPPMRADLGRRRTAAEEREVGRRYLHKHRWHPWRYNFWRFCRSLEQVYSPGPPSRRLDLAPRLWFAAQDFLRARRAPDQPEEVPTVETPVYLVVGGTAETSARTGVETYVRSLLAACGRIGAPVRPVMWREETRSLCLLPPELPLGREGEALRTVGDLSGRERSSAALTDPTMGDLRARWVDTPSLHELSAHRAVPPGAWVVLPEVLYGGRAAHWLEYVRRHGWRAAALVYDTMPNNEPRFFPLGQGHAHEEYLQAVSGADWVFPVSEFVAGDWRRFLEAKEVPEPAWTVCAPGADTFTPERVKVPPPRRDPVGSLRALCVCSVEPRKNLRALLAACESIWAERPDFGLDLCLVGMPRLFSEDNVPEAVREFIDRYPHRVRWHEWREYAALARLYEWCDFTVYPSVLEGSALPILESLWFRRPCICADTGVMKEVAAGGGCLAVDVYHPGVIAQAIVSLADSPETLVRLGEEIDARPLRTWEDAARELLAGLR